MTFSNYSTYSDDGRKIAFILQDSVSSKPTHCPWELDKKSDDQNKAYTFQGSGTAIYDRGIPSIDPAGDTFISLGYDFSLKIIQFLELRDPDFSLFSGVEVFGESSTSYAKNQEVFSKIKQYVESGQLSKARELIANDMSLESTLLAYWKDLLTMPKIKVEDRGSGKNSSKHIDWIKANGKNYKGQWVALKDGKFIKSHQDRSELTSILKQLDKLSGSLLFKMSD